MQTFDFEYNLPNGTPVIVEVDFFYEEPNPLSKESDWDFYGGLLIDDIRVYDGVEEISRCIPGDEIAFQFKKYKEDLELSYVMESNEYF